MSDDSSSADDWGSRATSKPAKTGAAGVIVNTSAARLVSGRGMVIAMFAFGLATTGAMWIYWTLHTGPFRPLQDALAAAFPHSSPRVDGGQRKMHKGTPKILRVVMRVDFDPVTEKARGSKMVESVEQIARQYIDLTAYDELELFLFQGVPEKEVRQQEYTRSLRSATVSGKPGADERGSKAKSIDRERHGKNALLGRDARCGG